MTNLRRSALPLLALLFCNVSLADAEDLATRKLALRDHADATRRRFQLLSTDPAIAYTDASAPGNNGASIHVYSDSDNWCLQITAGGNWTDTGTAWIYRNRATRNLVQIGPGKVKVKIRSNVGFTLSDDHPHGTINAQIQFGSDGESFCLRCDTPVKDEEFLYLAKNCAASSCAAEPPFCDTVATTTTSTTTTSTTTTTMPALPGAELKAVLPPSNGRFNYAMTIGLAGSDARCASEFAGSHTCSYAELQAAEAAGDLDLIKDTNGDTVNSFWAIDGAQPGSRQCEASLPWDYDTQHIGVFGDRVTLNNATGALGALEMSSLCQDMNWVGCCQ